LRKVISLIVAIVVVAASVGFIAVHDAFTPKPPVEKLDIGTCDYVKIYVLEERGWKRLKGPDSLIGDIFAYGGMAVNQYKFDIWWEDIWKDPSRLALGTAFACEVGAEGKVWKFFFGVGWNAPHMKRMYKLCGFSDDLHELDFVAICHEHIDHFWAIPAVLEVRPDIPIIIHEGFSDRAKAWLKELGHTGPLYIVPFMKPVTRKDIPILPPGFALVAFPGWIILDVYGEQGGVFNIKDRGLVTVTGCCHMGIVPLMHYAATHFKVEKGNYYGLYGGLHIALAEDWSPERNDWLIYVKKLDLEGIFANHCTGRVTWRKMVAMDMPAYWARTGHKILFGETIKWWDREDNLILEIYQSEGKWVYKAHMPIPEPPPPGGW